MLSLLSPRASCVCGGLATVSSHPQAILGRVSFPPQADKELSRFRDPHYLL